MVRFYTYSSRRLMHALDKIICDTCASSSIWLGALKVSKVVIDDDNDWSLFQDFFK